MKDKQHVDLDSQNGLPEGEKDERDVRSPLETISPITPISGEIPPIAGEVVTEEEIEEIKEGKGHVTSGAAGFRAGANGHALPDGLMIAGPGIAAPEGNGEPMEVGDPRGALMTWMCGYDDGPVSRRTGYPCRGKAMANRRCRFCGGNARRGAAHPKWKGGAYSKYMPKGVADRYKSAMVDPDLLSARDEIALVQLRIQDLMGKLKDGGTAEMWQELRDEFVNVEAAIRAGDPGALDKSLKALGTVIEAGSTAEEVWSEMYEAIEAKTKVSEREWRRLRDLRQFMTVQQSMDLVSYLVECVTRHVTDRDKLAMITKDMDKVLSAPQGRLKQ